MDSTQLSRFERHFSKWHPLDEQGLENAPQQPGVYVIRRAQGRRFGRLRGESDILYIGSCRAKKGLRQRLQQYSYPGPTQWTNLRVKELSEKFKMEVAWCVINAPNLEEPRNFECDLLANYLKDHDELPPLNHSGITYKRYREILHVTATVKKSL